jgi:elongation factor Ts
MASVDQIKRLRELTGLGMHDIKNALDEANGNEEQAMAILKEKGLATAAKKADRNTSQGLIEVYTHGGGRIGAMVEIKCETDFVARNDDFKNFVHDVVLQVAAMKPENVDELLKQEYFRDSSVTIQDLLTQTIAKIGENMKISRIARFELGE